MAKDNKETLKEVMEKSVHYLLETVKRVDWAKQKFEELKEELKAENERLKKKLRHIDTCLLGLANTKSEEGVKQLPELIRELREYSKQGQKGDKQCT